MVTLNFIVNDFLVVTLNFIKLSIIVCVFSCVSKKVVKFTIFLTLWV